MPAQRSIGSGFGYIPYDPQWECSVHNRMLAFPEWKAGGCFWCRPELMPINERAGADGKLSGHAAQRNRNYDAIRAMRPEQRRTPSYMWPESRVNRQAGEDGTNA